MNDETSKSTARPWYLDTEYDDDGDVVRILVRTDAGDYRVAKLYGHGGDAVTDRERNPNAALIVERVNGWEALVAERDALKVEVAAIRDELYGHLDDEVDLKAERDRLQAALLRVMSEPSLSRIDCQLLAAKALQP